MSNSELKQSFPDLQRRGFITAAMVAAGGVATSLWAPSALANLQPVTDKVLKVGVTSGPHEQVFEAVKKVAERDYGLKIEIVSFSDYVMPNAALDAGDLDANSFQHGPFLQAAIRARGTSFTAQAAPGSGRFPCFPKSTNRWPIFQKAR